MYTSREEIAEYLKPGAVGWRIEIFQEVSSTMDVARELLASGCGHGLVVLAEAQRSGRGRRGAPWRCPPGKGILMTVALELTDIPLSHPARSWLAAVAAAECCRRLGVQAGLKWPNDVVVLRTGTDNVKSSVRKIAGVLVESVNISHRSDEKRFDLLGIGLNVNQRENDFPGGLDLSPTSILIETGTPRGLPRTAAVLLNCISNVMEKIEAEGCDSVGRLWRSMSVTTGMEFTAVARYDRFRCTFEGVTDNGEAILKVMDGSQRIVRADEVHLIPE